RHPLRRRREARLSQGHGRLRAAAPDARQRLPRVPEDLSLVKRIDLLDLPEDSRDLVRECEAQGARTVFERNGRPVAVLVSYDEYMALRETIEIANDPMLYAKIEMAEEEGRTGRLLLVEDLLGDEPA